MAKTVTLAELKRQARELADQEPSLNTFVDETELREMINSSIDEWYGMVAMAVPERYETLQSLTVGSGAASTTNINSTSGEALLATDHLATLSVDYVRNPTSSNERFELRRLTYQERNLFTRRPNTGRALGYRLIQGNIRFNPVPTSSGETYEHRYVPVAPSLTSDADTLDGVNGWEQWIVHDVAARMLIKEESDESRVRAKQDRIERNIVAAMEQRIWGDSNRVTDVRRRHVHELQGFFGQFDPDFWV